MDGDTEHPRLPPELEEHIFVLSHAQCIRQHILPLNLFFIAKRVYEWLIPRHYEVIMFYTATSDVPPNITQSQLKRYGHHTRHFYTSMGTWARVVLNFCPYISNLAHWGPIPPDAVESMMKLSISHLSINILELFKVQADIRPFCANITHLEMTSRSPWATEDALSHFPALTHIVMFNGASEEDIQGCLTYGKSVNVVALTLLTMEGNDFEEMEGPHRDPRVVYVQQSRVYREDWKEGAYGGMDVWTFVDELMERRRPLGRVVA